jgi:formate hydrogenlyase subunit 6/NADH:ubiquinone oxidoreductase subunit I
VRLQSQKKYPRVHFLAERDLTTCIQCGICAKRCPFDAFHHDGSTIEVKGKKRKNVDFDPEQCFGCGLCATACPVDAIRMRSIS